MGIGGKSTVRADQTAAPSKQTVGFQVAGASGPVGNESRPSPATNHASGNRADLSGPNASEGRSVTGQGAPKRAWAGKRGSPSPATGSDAPLNGAARAAGPSFTTDTEISGGHRAELFGRELQKWEPDGDEAGLEDLSLATTPRGKGGHWDQFEANRRQFGVRTSFNEDIYTTKLDKSKARISEREAARIAAEIEGKRASNAHQAEERGQIAYREADEDEEARYSAVDRGTGPGSDQPGIASPSAATDAAGQNGKKPWSSAAGSVAAVSGRPAKASTPIDVDPRKEHNKVRMQLAGKTVVGSRERSPYGTPKTTRSLVSPLVGNASQVEALDLNPGSARFDAGIRSEFARFKKASRHEGTSPTDSELAKEASASASAKSGSAPSTPEDRTLAAPEAQSRTDTAQGGRPASAQLPGRATGAAAMRPQGEGPQPALLQPRPGRQQNGAVQIMTGPTLPGHGRYGPQGAVLPHMVPGPHLHPMQQGLPHHGGDLPTSNYGAPAPRAVIATPAARPSSGPPQSSPAFRPQPAPTSTPQAQAATPSRPSTSKLNPMAKEFTLNPAAKAFTPGQGVNLSRANSAASSVAHSTTGGTGARPAVRGSPAGAMGRQASGQMERGPSRELPNIRPQSRSPPHSGPRIRPGQPMPTSAGPFPMGAQRPPTGAPLTGPQPRFMTPPQGYHMPFMHGSPVYMANGQGVMPYAVTFSPPAAGFPQQGYPQQGFPQQGYPAMMYGSIPMQMGGSMPPGQPPRPMQQ